MLECPEEAWEKIFDINVKTSFLLFKECVPHMQASVDQLYYHENILKHFAEERRRLSSIH